MTVVSVFVIWWGKVSGINRIRVADHPNTCRVSTEHEMSLINRRITLLGGPEECHLMLSTMRTGDPLHLGT